MTGSHTTLVSPNRDPPLNAVKVPALAGKSVADPAVNVPVPGPLGMQSVPVGDVPTAQEVPGL